MSRKQASGVGRGHGAGSRRTQFQEGMPSRNPKGRPRKPKEVPSKSLMQALGRQLTQMVDTYDGGKRKRMAGFDAIASVMMHRLATASLRDQLSFARVIAQQPEAFAPDHQPSPETIADFVRELASCHEADEFKDPRFEEARLDRPTPPPSRW